MVSKLKAFIDFLINVILDYLKKIVHNLITITTIIRKGAQWKKSSETF